MKHRLVLRHDFANLNCSIVIFLKHARVNLGDIKTK